MDETHTIFEALPGSTHEQKSVLAGMLSCGIPMGPKEKEIR